MEYIDKMIQDLNLIYEDLEKTFGQKIVDKVYSHFTSLMRKIEDLEKSRDNWKKKYFRLKKIKGGGK